MKGAPFAIIRICAMLLIPLNKKTAGHFSCLAVFI